MYGKVSTMSGRVKITCDKGYLRLQFPTALSRKLYGKRQFFKGLGRQDTPENHEWAERIAARIQADLDHPDCEKLFDPALSKYFDIKVTTNVVLHPATIDAIELKDIWIEFVDYKRKSGQISETTYKTRYSRTYANWLNPYMARPLSYELAEGILFGLLETGINKPNLKKLISTLKQACDRAVIEVITTAIFLPN